MKPSPKRTSKGLWWDRAWSLVDGCTPVSEGCAHCWSASMARRFGRDFSEVTPRWDRLELPLRVKRPTVWAVWNDLFHEQAKPNLAFISDVFRVIRKCGHHLFLVLTKRPDWAMIALNYLNAPDNLWLGVTAENQQRADERIPVLLRIPAAKRFVSVEPMLERVRLGDIPDGTGGIIKPLCGLHWQPTPSSWPHQGLTVLEPVSSKIDFVICGAETGPGKRPMDLQWARDLREQCKQAGVPFWFKQGPGGEKTLDGKVVREWPE